MDTSTYSSFYPLLDIKLFWKFRWPKIQRSWFRPLLSIRVREQPSFILYCVYTRAIVTCHYLLSTNCTNDDRYLNHFFLVSDGNAAGTGPGDPWTGGSGGVQPPYSGYAPPHLAQPAYPMHLPHDPMVRRLSLVPFFPSSLRSREASIPPPFLFLSIDSLITRLPSLRSSPIPLHFRTTNFRSVDIYIFIAGKGGRGSNRGNE